MSHKTSTLSLGDLIAGLCDTFEAAYGDPGLAAVATESTLTDLFGSRRASFARFARQRISSSERGRMNGQPRWALEPAQHAV